MAPPSPEHEAATREMIRLLLDKLRTLRLQPSTSLVVQSFIKTIQRRGAEAILLDDNSKLCPDEQLASTYDTTSPIIIEVACSQKFYGARGLKWKLSQEIIDSRGNINVGLGLKISIEQIGWNPHFTLYRPCCQTNPTGTGGTMRVETIFEQMSLTDPSASQDLTLTLGDLISEQSRPTIVGRFPGLQNELDLPIPITFAEVAAAVAAAKACVDARNQTRAAIGQPTSASLDITKEYPTLRDPDSASDLESPESSEDDNDAVPEAIGGDAKGDGLIC